jgi:hypothetical protein
MMNRRRRNPGTMSELTSGSLIPGVVGGAAGFFGARFIPQNLPMISSYNNGIMGYGLNIISGLGISWLLSKWKKAAGMGALIGTGVAVIARIVVDQSAAPSSAQAPAAQAAAMSGLGSDMDFDMGYYVSDGFPFPQGSAGGPYAQFPGTPWAGAPPQLATSASAVRAGVMAAAAAMPAAATSSPAGATTDRWGNNWA